MKKSFSGLKSKMILLALALCILSASAPKRSEAIEVPFVAMTTPSYTGQFVTTGLFLFVAGPVLTVEAIYNQFWYALPGTLGCIFWCPILGVIALDQQGQGHIQFESLAHSTEVNSWLKSGQMDFNMLADYEADRDQLNALSEQLALELVELPESVDKVEYSTSFWKNNFGLLSPKTHQLLTKMVQIQFNK